MPRNIPQEELDAILKVVGKFPEGITIDALNNTLGIDFKRRTLQRRLAFLVNQEKLKRKGEKRGSRYYLPSISGSVGLDLRGVDLTAHDELYIPISDDAKKIKANVQQPLHKRQPVGYELKFLEAYEPNKSFYLSKNTRNDLLKMGKPIDDLLPAGTYAKQIINRLLIDLSWNSSRLEGNTYSLLETERLLELGEGVEGKDAQEAQMILNHKAAIELLVDQAAEIEFNRYTICNLHALLSDNLLGDPQACGRLRKRSVGVHGSVFHPLDVPQKIEECFLNILEKASKIIDPFEQAFFAMVQIPYLQPFEDVNKRVSRLSANISLIKQNLCPLSFIDVPERAYVDGVLGIYELNKIDLLRDVFIWAYERSCKKYSAVQKSLGEPDQFRLRNRQNIIDVISEIIRKSMDKKSAIEQIKKVSFSKLPENDHKRFIEVVETELMNLHEGNIARFQIRPSEYEEWKKTWK